MPHKRRATFRMKRSIPYIYSMLAAMLIFAASCSTPEKHHKKGDMFFSHGEYFDAAAEYKTAYSTTPRADKEARGQRAFLMGECYRRINSTSKAEGAYRNAVRYNYVDTTTYFWLAETQRMQGNYKEARKNYELYQNIKPDDQRTKAGIESCTLGPKMKAEGSNYSVHAVPLFASRRADYCPVLFGEKYDQLIFTSTRPQATGDDDSGITGMKNGDLFYTSKDDKGKWKPVESLQGNVNTAFDEGAPAISPDGQTLYFTYCSVDPEYPRYAEIYSSTRSDATWSKPQKVEISADTLSSYAHPAVSPDGKWLYFVSDMPGGIGGLDIWRVQLDSHGMGVPENLGEPVNTPGDEEFPTFRFNGDLYFSSNGHPGMGGLDIYCAHPDTINNKWRVEILPSPVNSSGDDFGMTFEGVYNRGFFSSNRKNGRGWDHIFSFERPEIVQTVTGWVFEQDGYELPQSTVYMIGNDGTNLKFGVRSDGSFEQVIKPGVKYVLLATCDGFLNYKQEVTVDSSDVSTCDTVYFPLPSVNSPVLVRNVFYEFNSAKLTDDSRQALDKLAQLLKDNANITIELSSHCDYRGNELYNRKLSQHRAESVVEYLTEHGIDAARLTAVGYGKLRPKVATKRLATSYKFLHEGDTLTEAFIKKLKESEQDTCNALNRRTEFRVLKTTYGLFDDKGNIDSKALLGNNKADKKGKTEPVVKVYIPTPAEAAAADGKPLPAKKDTVKQTDKKPAVTTKKPDATNAKAATETKAVKAADNKAQQDTTKRQPATANAQSAAAKAQQTTAEAEKTKKAVANSDTAKVETNKNESAKNVSVKEKNPKASNSNPKASNLNSAASNSNSAASNLKDNASRKNEVKQKTDSVKKTPTQTVVYSAKAVEAKEDSAKAAKAKADSLKAAKQKADSLKAARAKADSIKKAAVKESAAQAASAQQQAAQKKNDAVKSGTKTDVKATKQPKTSAKTDDVASKNASPAVKMSKAEKDSAKAAAKAAKAKLKAEQKAKADSLKLAKKKAKAAAKAKAKAAKEKAKLEKEKAKLAAAKTKNAKSSTVKTTVRKTAATAKAASTSAKTASTTAKNTETKASTTKTTAKKLTLKEREAVKDSIIAKAKRDAEAAKQKAKKQ